jgi:hypothetical protein
MSKVLVDREEIEAIRNTLANGGGAVGVLRWAENVLAQPAEAEGVEVVAFLMEPDMYEPYVSLRRDSRCQGSIEPLMTVAQHRRALSAVTAERDRLREAFSECIESLNCEMLQKFGGRLPGDMHPVTRRDYDRDMAEIAEYRAALAAKEA